MHDGHVHLRLCAYLPRTAVPLAEFLSSGNLAPKLRRSRARRARVHVAHIEFSLDGAIDNLALKLPRNRARRARVRVAHIEFSFGVALDNRAALDDADRCRARLDKLKRRPMACLLPITCLTAQFLCVETTG